jgi:hypothetical protein
MFMYKVDRDNVSDVIRDVFGTDRDLYERRYHGEDKTLDGAVDYVMGNKHDRDWETHP